MKFKNLLKPEVVVYCKTERESLKLLEYLGKMGYKWPTRYSEEKIHNAAQNDAYYFIDGRLELTYGNDEAYEVARFNYDLINFEDLIEPDISTLELVDWMKEHNEPSELAFLFYCTTWEEVFDRYDSTEIIQRITTYNLEREDNDNC